jgi:hypothetical protein
MSRNLRLVVLVFLSTAFGVAGLYGVIALLNIVFNAYVTMERYGTVYAVTTAIPLGLLAALWLDYFLGTGILPDGVTGTASGNGGTDE